MPAFADLLDLRTGVVELIGRSEFVDVFPRLVSLAETTINRRLRCREQVSEATLAVTNGAATLPADFIEAIGVYDGAGNEYLAQPPQALRMVQGRGYYAIVGSTLIARTDETLTLQYYATIPALTGMSGTNWVLTKHPGLYLYAVAVEAAKYLRDAEAAGALMPVLNMEFAEIAALDASERYARARVRVQGPTP